MKLNALCKKCKGDDWKHGKNGWPLCRPCSNGGPLPFSRKIRVGYSYGHPRIQFTDNRLKGIKCVKVTTMKPGEIIITKA